MKVLIRGTEDIKNIALFNIHKEEITEKALINFFGFETEVYQCQFKEGKETDEPVNLDDISERDIIKDIVSFRKATPDEKRKYNVTYIMTKEFYKTFYYFVTDTQGLLNKLALASETEIKRIISISPIVQNLT